MSAIRFVRYAIEHPLGGRSPLRTFLNVAGWQLRSRLSAGPHRFAWIEGSCLMIRRGMTGATGNIYYGLHEFFDMGFLLHFLRDHDIFADVGANIGSYTVLAAKVCGASVVSFEPDPVSAGHFMANVTANGIENRVRLVEAAVGNAPGVLQFTVGLDTMNHAVKGADTGAATRSVPMTTLDIALADSVPIFMKIDVEGFEDQVAKGGETILADQRLRGLEIETVSDVLVATLEGHGFRAFDYDPFTRRLSPSAGLRQGHNQLFLRDLPFIEARVANAKPFRTMGVTI